MISVTTDGKTIKQVIDISASEGHIVPTAIAKFHDSFYVGNLSLFPIDPQWARILIISKDGNSDDDDLAPGFDKEAHGYHIVKSTAGFTTVVAVDSVRMDCCTSSNYLTPRAPVHLHSRARWCGLKDPVKLKMWSLDYLSRPG